MNKITNDKSVNIPLELQQYLDFTQWFCLRNKGVQIPLTGADIRMSVAKLDGTDVLSFTLGDCLELSVNNPAVFWFKKPANQKELAPGKYRYDVLIKFPGNDWEVPIKGYYTVIPSITNP